MRRMIAKKTIATSRRRLMALKGMSLDSDWGRRGIYPFLHTSDVITIDALKLFEKVVFFLRSFSILTYKVQRNCMFKTV